MTEGVVECRTRDDGKREHITCSITRSSVCEECIWISRSYTTSVFFRVATTLLTTASRSRVLRVVLCAVHGVKAEHVTRAVRTLHWHPPTSPEHSHPAWHVSGPVALSQSVSTLQTRPIRPLCLFLHSPTSGMCKPGQNMTANESCAFPGQRTSGDAGHVEQLTSADVPLSLGVSFIFMAYLEPRA